MRARVPTFAKATVGKGVRAGAENSPFLLFKKFPRVRIGLFAKADSCSSDEECAFRLGFGKVTKLNQVHGNLIHIAEKMNGIADGDGLTTATPGLALSIRFADCQAFAAYAPEKKVLGLIHAGWRGMAANVITKFFEALEETFEIAPSETYVYAAPSLCRKCAVFSDPYEELPKHLHPFIGRNSAWAKAHATTVDLRAAADAELDALGIPGEKRERHPSCTKCDPSFWSWRRDNSAIARNYLVAGMTFR